jgi:hypothetical protein
MRKTSSDSYDVKLESFLYAVIPDDRSGAPLTVLSLLARKNLDPWEEAANYAQSPGAAAVASLSDLLAEVMPYSFLDERVCTEAVRLLDLLPSPHYADPVAQNPTLPVIADLLKRLKEIFGIPVRNDRR